MIYEHLDQTTLKISILFNFFIQIHHHLIWISVTSSHNNAKETQKQIVLVLYGVLVSSMVIKTPGKSNLRGKGRIHFCLTVPDGYSSSWWGKALQQKHGGVQTREDRQQNQVI